MCLFGGPQMSGGGQVPMPAAPPPLPAQAATPTEVDPEVKRARDESRKRAASLAGYGSTIATSGLGVTTPAPLTTAGGKALLGQ